MLVTVKDIATTAGQQRVREKNAIRNWKKRALIKALLEGIFTEGTHPPKASSETDLEQ